MSEQQVTLDATRSESWTPGPWQVVERDGIYVITSPHGNPVNCHEVADTWRVKPDADLIALAPEMAEAIEGIYLRCCNEAPGNMSAIFTTPEWATVALTVERLRAIGAPR